LEAVAAEDAATKKLMPSAEDAAALAKLMRAASFRDNDLTEARVAEGRALIAAEAETGSEEEDEEEKEEEEEDVALQESLEEKADWMSPTTHKGNIVDNSSKEDINTAQGLESPGETFWKQFDPKEAQKLAKQRSALMAPGEEQSCSDEEAPGETGCAAGYDGEAHSTVEGGGKCYSGGSAVSKTMLLLLTLFTVASPTNATATSSTLTPLYPPTHPVGRWQQLGVSSWGAGYREQRYKELPLCEATMCKDSTTLAKHEENARTTSGAPRGPFFGRHRLHGGACSHGASERKLPVYGRSWPGPAVQLERGKGSDGLDHQSLLGELRVLAPPPQGTCMRRICGRKAWVSSGPLTTHPMLNRCGITHRGKSHCTHKTAQRSTRPRSPTSTSARSTRQIQGLQPKAGS
jgi:hypothetical protein